MFLARHLRAYPSSQLLHRRMLGVFANSAFETVIRDALGTRASSVFNTHCFVGTNQLRSTVEDEDDANEATDSEGGLDNNEQKSREPNHRFVVCALGSDLREAYTPTQLAEIGLFSPSILRTTTLTHPVSALPMNSGFAPLRAALLQAGALSVVPGEVDGHDENGVSQTRRSLD